MVRTKDGEELHLRVTGRNTTEASEELKADIKKYGKEIFSREILSLHETKGTCNYEETKQLFLNNVLTESVLTQETQHTIIAIF